MLGNALPFTTINELAVHVGSGATPRGGSEVYTTEGILFIRSQNVRFEGLDLSDVAFIDERTHRNMGRSVVFPADVLLNITGASIGRCCVLPSGLGPANVNQHVCAIRLTESTARDAGYLSAVLASHVGQAQVDRLNAGGNREGLNYQQIRAFEIPWPKAEERRQIAEILDTLDEAIRKTEQVIAKLQQMKQGLLHDLLTRGIDENGELRDPERHPEQFKDSSLGRIPRGWTVTNLGAVATWHSGGTPSKSIPGYWRGNIPWVSPKDMKQFRIGDTQDKTTAAGIAAGSRMVFPGTVLIVVRGMILAHTFPVCLTTRNVAFNQDVKALVPAQDVDGAYLAHWFVGNAAQMLGLVTEATHGTKRIDLADLQSYPIGIPPLAEQVYIAKFLDIEDSRIAGEHGEIARLRSLKQGLMDDLLTGRVRVTKPLESAA